MKKKVCVVTGSRAEYGLLYWLMKGIDEDDDLELQVVVTGMHLSPEFGLTYKEIEKDFKINVKIEMLLSSDTPVGISKSMGLAQISFADAYCALEPDLIVVLGDRYEILSAVSAAMVARIPIAHIHGGETTEGAFDESIRHSITKMSHLHFTSTEVYKKRVIQLGEQPERVFTVGGMGIENIKRLKLLTKAELEVDLGFKFNSRNILITFHPVTLEQNTAQQQFQNLIDVVDALIDTNIIFTKSNSDTDGRIINQMIDKYVACNRNKAVGVTSLGQVRYLSTLQFVDAVVGNSSSGLIEAPSFQIGTINVGDRQKGRIAAKSVIHCKSDKQSIQQAFSTLYSPMFKSQLKDVINPYGDGYPSYKIIEEIKKVKIETLLKKNFYDLRVSNE